MIKIKLRPTFKICCNSLLCNSVTFSNLSLLGHVKKGVIGYSVTLKSLKGLGAGAPWWNRNFLKRQLVLDVTSPKRGAVAGNHRISHSEIATER